MQFTGKNLELLRRALELALGDIRTQVGTCPDPINDADYLDELEQDGEVFKQWIERIDKRLA